MITSHEIYKEVISTILENVIILRFIKAAGTQNEGQNNITLKINY